MDVPSRGYGSGAMSRSALPSGTRAISEALGFLKQTAGAPRGCGGAVTEPGPSQRSRRVARGSCWTDECGSGAT